MFVIVPVIAIWTMHVAFFAMIVPVMVVIVGIAQGRVHQLLDCDRSCALGLGGLDRQCHDLGAQTDVVDLAQIMPAQAALAVE